MSAELISSCAPKRGLLSGKLSGTLRGFKDTEWYAVLGKMPISHPFGQGGSKAQARITSASPHAPSASCLIFIMNQMQVQDCIKRGHVEHLPSDAATPIMMAADGSLITDDR